jgi:hypothetical protein
VVYSGPFKESKTTVDPSKKKDRRYENYGLLGGCSAIGDFLFCCVLFFFSKPLCYLKWSVLLYVIIIAICIFLMQKLEYQYIPFSKKILQKGSNTVPTDWECYIQTILIVLDSIFFFLSSFATYKRF